MLLLFLAVCFLAGGTNIGRRIFQHPVVLTAFSVTVAASYYLLRVVL